jgi:hypothetical protein
MSTRLSPHLPHLARCRNQLISRLSAVRHVDKRLVPARVVVAVADTMMQAQLPRVTERHRRSGQPGHRAALQSTIGVGWCMLQRARRRDKRRIHPDLPPPDRVLIGPGRPAIRGFLFCWNPRSIRPLSHLPGRQVSTPCALVRRARPSDLRRLRSYPVAQRRCQNASRIYNPNYYAASRRYRVGAGTLAGCSC